MIEKKIHFNMLADLFAQHFNFTSNSSFLLEFFILSHNVSLEILILHEIRRFDT